MEVVMICGYCGYTTIEYLPRCQYCDTIYCDNCGIIDDECCDTCLDDIEDGLIEIEEY